MVVRIQEAPRFLRTVWPIKRGFGSPLHIAHTHLANAPKSTVLVDPDGLFLVRDKSLHQIPLSKTIACILLNSFGVRGENSPQLINGLLLQLMQE